MSAEKTILIVDDAEDLRETLVDSLELHGFNVLDAEDSASALEIIDSHPVHFVLTDIRMPKMDGVALLKAIKAKKSKTPDVILMSGFSEYDTEEVKSWGALDLVEKPFDLDRVANLIHATIEKDA